MKSNGAIVKAMALSESIYHTMPGRIFVLHLSKSFTTAGSNCKPIFSFTILIPPFVVGRLPSPD